MAPNEPPERQPDPAERRPPVPVGRYELVSPLVSGSAALGDVWKARIGSGPEVGRFVALRLVPRSADLDSSAVELITKAGFSAMELRHPKIAAVLDVVVAETQIALVSEYIGGSLLHAIVRPASGKRTNVPAPVVARIAIDVLEALEGVGKGWLELFPSTDTDDDRIIAGGIHGGLSVDNLLVASFGETLLLETGLAGVALSIPKFANQPDAISYRAPEQLDGKGPADERSDLFTLGAILWELAAGRSLFGAAFFPRPAHPSGPSRGKGVGDALQVSNARHKVLTAPIPRLDSLPLLQGKVTKALADCVARCLDRDRAARFQSIREALEAFRALGPSSVASHDVVARFIASMGAEQAAGSGIESAPTIESNRPTVPPVEGPETAPPQTTRGPTATAESLDRSTLVPDLVTLAPGPLGPESAPSSMDLTTPGPDTPERLVPEAPLDVASPDSVEPETLPTSLPAAGSPKQQGAFPGPDGPEVPSAAPWPAASSGPEPMRIDVPAASEGDAGIAAFGGFPDTTSAPVVRALGDGFPAVSDSLPPDSREDESRRQRSKKVVFGVVAFGVVIFLVAVLRVLMSSRSSETLSATSTAAPVTQAAASAAAAPEKGEPAPSPTTEQHAEPERHAAAAHAEPAVPAMAPTSSPSAASAPPGGDTTKKAVNPKKKVFRPTDI